MQITAPSSTRIHAIDAIRGFCLLNIFINHIYVGVLNGFSPSRVMFSDSAEAFVFLAGVSCFLAYSPRAHQRSFAEGRTKVWRRALTLFWVNMVIALASLGILLVSAKFADPANPAIFPTEMIREHGLATYLWHILTMQQNIGYTVVLRLYVALLVIAPLYIWLATIRFWLPLIPAGAIWVTAGHFGLVEINSLNHVDLALTLLPWNLVFAAGIALGAAIVQQHSFPKNSFLTGAATVLALAGPIYFVVLTRLSPEILDWVNARNDYFWTGASKTLQSPLRVLYMAALAYLFIAWRRAPVVRMVHSVSVNNPLTQLGRKSLEVFAAGAILAVAIDNLLWALSVNRIVPLESANAIALEIALTAAAFIIMLRIARNDRFTAAAIGKHIQDSVFSRRQRSNIARA